MNLFQILAVNILILHISSAQVFPFSNLRAFFDPKIKQEGKNDHNSNSATNISRPYREADDNFELPSLQEFDSPDVFTINRDSDNHRIPQVKRQSIPTELSTSKSKRLGIGGRYHSRIRSDESLPKSNQKDSVDLVFITPKPNSDHSQQEDEEEIVYSKLKSKSVTRRRKPQPDEDSGWTVTPVEYGSMQITTDKEEIILPFSKIEKSHEFTLSPQESTIVQSVPSLGVTLRQNNFDPNDGLIDYLVPPKLPSVYQQKLIRHNPRSSPNSKPPTQTAFSKKDNRFRIKKHRNELKATNVPLADRLTSPPKRQIPRRRPSLLRPHPVRNPTGEKIPNRDLELQQQATQMDEQITAETGFTGAATHPHSSHDNARVEFQMHGQKGPHSYKFGYDTGKGHNRQFRFEEKDNHGHVKGHYGYYDKDGKLQVVNYEADPEHGFKAESV